MKEKNDPGFVADVIAMQGHDTAKRLLRLLGCVENSEVCEHDWHKDGMSSYCQKCGKTR